MVLVFSFTKLKLCFMNTLVKKATLTDEQKSWATYNLHTTGSANSGIKHDKKVDDEYIIRTIDPNFEHGYAHKSNRFYQRYHFNAAANILAALNH
ncbi:hypothetical protein BH11BAC4_BH11BAC4_24800 [soil metagenome]